MISTETVISPVALVVERALVIIQATVSSMCFLGIELTYLFTVAFSLAGMATLCFGLAGSSLQGHDERRPIACVVQAFFLFVIAFAPWLVGHDNVFDRALTSLSALVPKRGEKLNLNHKLAIGALVLFVILMNRPYWRWRIKRWGSRYGYQVQNVRGLRFWERPLTSSQYQRWFDVTLIDRDGQLREAQLCFGSFWGLNPNSVRICWLDRKGGSLFDPSS